MSRDVDVEKPYNKREVAAKLRRLADALEQGKAFQSQIAGHRVHVPARATVELEYEREATRRRSKLSGPGAENLLYSVVERMSVTLLRAIAPSRRCF